MTGPDSGVINHPSFWPACAVIFTVLAAEATGIWFLSPVVAQVSVHERRISDLEAKAQSFERTNAEARLTALEVSREQRWTIITGGLAAVREELAAMRTTLESTRATINRLQDRADNADRPQLGRAVR